MNKPRLRPLLALLALSAVGPLQGAVPLPFVLQDPDSFWEMSTVERDAGSGITMQAVFVRAGGKVRFVVLRAPKAGDSTEALKGFAAQLKSALMTGKGDNLAEKEAVEFGYTGEEEHFDLLLDKEPASCELFVFNQDKNSWAVLYIAPRGIPRPVPSPFAILHPKAAAAPGVVEMEPFHARDTPVTSFPIGIAVTPDLLTGRIIRIVVSEVPEGSTTDRAGVRVGDEILSVNHRKSQDFALGLSKHSELGVIFLNRDPGDEVELEVRTPGSTKSRKVVLEIPEPRNFVLRPMP